MRRNSRTEFRDARSAAIEARKAMLERVGLRQPETEPEPSGGGRIDFTEVDGDRQAVEAMQDTINRMMERIYRESGTPWPQPPRSDPLTDIQRAVETMRQHYNTYTPRWVCGMYGSQPQTGLMPDAYRGGQQASVHAMYDPITWPDEGYPCQLCWSAKRWPWEPMRSCPVTVDVESTYCENHGGKAEDATGVWVDAGTIENLSAPTLAELSRGRMIMMPSLMEASR